MSNFKTGDKVVCVSGFRPEPHHVIEQTPVVGTIYLVTDIRFTDRVYLQVSGASAWSTKRFLLLFKKKTGEAYWDAGCFRKLVTASERASASISQPSFTP